MKKFLILIRPQFKDKDAPIAERRLEGQSIELAQTIYKDNTVYRVSVLKYDSATLFGNKYELVFKRESMCKHTTLQIEYPFRIGRWVQRCVVCGEEVKTPLSIGELEKKYGDDQN